MFGEEDEIRVYTSLRARAVAVEEEVYDFMYARDECVDGMPMPDWRWITYHRILVKVRELSVLRAWCEPDEDQDQDEHGDEAMVHPGEPIGSVF